MKLKRLTMFTLLGVALTGAASASQAAATQADWTNTLQVKLALLDKLGTDSLHIDVNSLGDTVTLAGTVDKRETMELASTVAKSVAGVVNVDNDIRLEATVANSSKVGAAVGEADSEVKDAVLETRLRLALINKMGSDGFKIGTDAASGVVTLTFDPAFDRKSRKQAVAIATGMAGVSKVVSVNRADKT